MSARLFYIKQETTRREEHSAPDEDYLLKITSPLKSDDRDLY